MTGTVFGILHGPERPTSFSIQLYTSSHMFVSVMLQFVQRVVLPIKHSRRLHTAVLVVHMPYSDCQMRMCYTEKAPIAWHRRGNKRQETPTIKPNDHQPTQLTDQAPSSIERAPRE